MKVLTKGALVALLLAGVAAPALAQVNTSTATGSGSVTIIRPITVTADKALLFGTLIRPASGSGDATVANAGGLTVSGGIFSLASGGASQPAEFTIKGEAGQAFTLNVADNFDLHHGGDTLTVTTNQSVADGTITPAGAVGDVADAVTLVKVGGKITVANTTPSGLYSGTFAVTATYN
jgi:hypothetical protein